MFFCIARASALHILQVRSVTLCHVDGRGVRHCEERSNPAPCMVWIASFLAMTVTAASQ
ncbi:MAG: hypothetical protein LBT42_00180 [Tannerella sp.]|nr:hypothetical protein [Tannerella sp.]